MRTIHEAVKNDDVHCINSLIKSGINVTDADLGEVSNCM